MSGEEVGRFLCAPQEVLGEKRCWPQHMVYRMMMRLNQRTGLREEDRDVNIRRWATSFPGWHGLLGQGWRGGSSRECLLVLGTEIKQ